MYKMDIVEKFIFGFFACMLMIFISIFLMAGWELTGRPCYAKANMYGLDSTYSIQTGCFVKLRDTLVPISDIIAVEKDGKIIYTTKNTFRHEEIKSK